MRYFTIFYNILQYITIYYNILQYMIYDDTLDNRASEASPQARAEGPSVHASYNRDLLLFLRT